MTDEPTEPSNEEHAEEPRHDAAPRRPGPRHNGGSHADARPRPRPTGVAHRPDPAARPRPARPARRPGTILPAADEVEHAEATHLEVHGRVGSAMAQSMQVHRGAVGGAQAEDVQVTFGALGGARAQRITVDRGAIGGAIAGDFRLRMGFAQRVLARDVSIEQGGARTVIGYTVRVGPQSGALLVIARRVEGGRFLFDWRAALAFGAAFALVTALFRQRSPGR
jgi:hypothetical protein